MSAPSSASTTWGVLWDFKGDGSDRWLDDFVPAGRHSFTKISTHRDQQNWHTGRGRRTRLSTWAENAALSARGWSGLDGIITVFPQLAVAVGLRNRMPGGGRPRHVAWGFNIGHHPTGLKRAAATAALAHVDRLVVHSSGEVETVRDLFGLHEHQVEFVHLQAPERPTLAEEELARPFLVSIGSANRDYPTLIEALRRTGLPAKIVAAERLHAALRPPDNVELISGLSAEECLRIAQRARISVVPIDRPHIASGQVTFIDAMKMGRPVVATRSIGTVDYVRERETGLLVEPGDVDGMARTLEELWDDQTLRHRIGAGGRRFADQELSDPAIGARLGALLDSVAPR